MKFVKKCLRTSFCFGRTSKGKSTPQLPEQTDLKDNNEVKIYEKNQIEPNRGVEMIGKYTLGKTIGHGTQGEVKECLNDDNIRFAVKTIPKKRTLFRKTQANKNKIDLNQKILKEIEIMKSLDHPNIVRLFEVIESDVNKSIFLVMEFIDNGTIMKDSLEPQKPFSEEKAKDLFRQLIKGLEYLHFHDIFHRDIKPSNLLITKTGLVKISDFGVSFLCNPSSVTLTKEVIQTSGSNDKQEYLSAFNKAVENKVKKSVSFKEPVKDKVLFSSKTSMSQLKAEETSYIQGKLYPPTPKVITEKLSQLTEEGNISQISGTLAFLPPEAFAESHCYNGRVADVWACGATLFMFVFGVPPFNAETQSAISELILKQEVEFPKEISYFDETLNKKVTESVSVSQELKDLIQKLLMKDTKLRLKTTEQVKKHSWVCNSWKRSE